MVIKIFYCWKKHPERGVIVDSTDVTHENEMKVVTPDFGNQCCEFNEEMNNKFPEPLMDAIGTSTFFYSNHGHAKVTGESKQALFHH